MKKFTAAYKNDEQRKVLGVTLSGSLTSVNAINFKKEMRARVALDEANFEMDLSSLDALDLAGVNTLVTLHKNLSGQGRKLTLLTNKQHPAFEFLYLTKFIDLFHFQRA